MTDEPQPTDAESSTTPDAPSPAPATATETATESAPKRPKARRSRGVLAVVFLIIAALLVPNSIIARWIHNDLMDTQGYVNTVAPLSKDPAITDVLATQVVDTVFAQVKVQKRITDLLPDVLDPLGRPIANSLRNLADKETEKFLQSDRFQQMWIDANRVAHKEVVKLLTNRGTVVKTQGDAVVLDLGAVADHVRKDLVGKGLTFLKGVKIPDGALEFTLIQSQTVTKVQGYVRILDTLVTVLPFLTLAFAVAAVAVSVKRRRTLVALALAFSATSLLLVMGVNLVRVPYVTAASKANIDSKAAKAVFDVVTRALPDYAWTVFALGLVVAVVAFLTDPGRLAWVTRLVRGDRLAHRTGAAAWVAPRVVWLRVTAVVLAVLVLVVWSAPTFKVLAWVIVVLLIVLGVLGALARLAPAAEVSATEPEAGDAAEPAAGPESEPAPAGKSGTD